MIIVLWLWAASRRRPRPLTIAGTLLSLGGLVLVLDLTGAVKIDVVGVLWGIAAAVCLAIYFFITAKENDTLPPIVLASGGLMVGAVVMWLAAATGLLPMAFSTADTRLGPWVTPVVGGRWADWSSWPPCWPTSPALWPRGRSVPRWRPLSR